MNDLQDPFIEEPEELSDDLTPHLRAAGIVIDILTGGDDPQRDALLEIGAVAFAIDRSTPDGERVVEIDSFHVLLYPNPRLSISLERIRDQGRTLSGIWNPELPSEVLAYEQFRHWLGGLRAIPICWDVDMWGHDVARDAPFLMAWEKRVWEGSKAYEQNRIFPQLGAWCCTKMLINIAAGMGSLPPHPKEAPYSSSLSAFVDPYGDKFNRYIETLPEFNALEHARLALQVLDQMWIMVRQY